MSQLQNDRLLRALRRQPVDRTPVWIMRQAGRYLPEYRATRAKAGDFMTLCQTPELACEVTLQPLQRFALDAAIIFSDILTIPDAMGLSLYFVGGEGPKFQHPITNSRDIQQLPIPDAETELAYVMDAIRLSVRELAGRVPLIGFAGSPWTIATYMVEGGSSKNFSKIKGLLYSKPELLHALLAKNTAATIAYLRAQIAAGVSAVMVFDTWGGVLTPQSYRDFSLNYMAEIVTGLRQYAPDVPITLFTKNGGGWLHWLAETGCDAVGVDWTLSLADAKQRVAGRVALQGNLDPCVLYAEPAVIQAEVRRVLAEYGNDPGHVFNLGHGIHPDINPEHVAVLIDAVHQGLN